MYRIAYLLSAYIDAPHLHRLIQALHVPGQTEFFVHIDKKTDATPFTQLDENIRPHVHFVPRHEVFWGGFHQVLYIRELLKAAVSWPQGFNRVVLLSGMDYPLWSNQRIFQFFQEHPHIEMIGGVSLTDDMGGMQQRNITNYHLFRDSHLPLKQLPGTLLRLLHFTKRLTVNISGKECKVYKGSDYWSLTIESARYVLNGMEKEKQMMRYFSTSYIPSEMVANTLFYNSPLAPNAYMEPGTHWHTLAERTPLHYICYDGCIKTLTLADLDTLKQSGKMFCRKTASGISDELMNTIDLMRI